MDPFSIPELRLRAQHLASAPFKQPEDVVRHLGAVQAQDFLGAKWSLRMRMSAGTDASISQAYDDGKFLRTHVLRPTWHFVMPEDLRWMMELTAPRVRAFLAHYDRKLHLTPDVFRRSTRVIAKALEKHGHLTRNELAVHLKAARLPHEGQRLGHQMAHAELDALICSGRMKGKQFTYALVEERAPKQRKLAHDEALAELAARYIAGHGPAQAKDFAWWSSLSMKDVKAGLAMNAALKRETINGKEYWFPAKVPAYRPSTPSVMLLPTYDEYGIAFTDRSDMMVEGDWKDLMEQGLYVNAILLDGVAVGAWRRSYAKKGILIELQPFRPFTRRERNAIEEAAERFSAFLKLPVMIAGA